MNEHDEHRSKMKNVLNIFKMYKPYSLTCQQCGVRKIGLVLYSYLLEEFICSKKCFCLIEN